MATCLIAGESFGVPCDGVKFIPYIIIMQTICFWSFGVIGPILSKFEMGSTKVGAGAVGGTRRDGSVAILHYCTLTNSVKPCLLFSCLGGLSCFLRIFIRN